MIIVEGPDGSGKSTLIRNLGAECYGHFKGLRGGTGGENWGAPGVSAVDIYKTVLLDAGEREYFTRKTQAIDRFHISEHIYGPILRNKQEIGHAELVALSKLIGRFQVRVILCLPPFEETMANVMLAGRGRPAYQTVSFLREAYHAFVRAMPWAHVVYDYTKDPLP